MKKHIAKPATAEEILKALKIDPTESRILKVLSSIVEERKKPKVIYTITTMRFGAYEIPRGKNKGKKVQSVLDDRVVGWFKEKEVAIQCVKENAGDIYECGAYPYAVVEEVSAGLYPVCEKSWWFHWRRIGLSDGCYTRSRKPKSHKNVVNFAIG